MKKQNNIIIDFAKDCGIDIEDLIKEVHSSIVDKIKNEFIRRNMVKGERITNCLDRFFEKKC